MSKHPVGSCILAFVLACGSSSESGGTPDAGASSGDGGGSSSSSSGGAGSSSGDASTSSGGASSSGDSGAPSAWPDASNTGIPDGACASGLRDAVEDDLRPATGQVFECVRFADGTPYISDEVSSITYRFCRFESDSVDAFVNVQGGSVTFEDSEFAGGVGTWIRTAYAGNDLTVRRCDFSGMANAVEFGTRNVVIEDNYVHDFGSVDPEQHADGIQSANETPDLRVHHNSVFLNAVTGGTGALMLWGTGNSSVTDNLVAGGGYTLYLDGPMVITGNRISTKFSERSGEYGPVYPSQNLADATWSDNRWEDGPNAGQEVTIP